MASIDEKNPVLSGSIDYGRVFLTFARHTDEKIAHGLVFEALLAAVKDQGVVLRDGQPTALLDLGCGEGDTACEMIDAINRVHPGGNGVNYYGLDTDDRFVSSTQRLLHDVTEAKRVRTIDVRQADVLTGQSLPFPPMDHVLATMGHVLYYAHSRNGRQETRRAISAVVENVAELLGQDGVCLFAHSADHCPLATLRATVANSVEAKPAGMLGEIAAGQGLDIVSFVVPYKLHFPRLTPEQWEDCKHPARYNLLQGNNRPGFVATLELLSFVAQRGLKGLAQEGKLDRFVDNLRTRIDRDGAFHGLSDYQLMLSRRHSSRLRAGVEAAIHQIVSALPRIRKQAEEAFKLNVSLQATPQ